MDERTRGCERIPRRDFVFGIMSSAIGGSLGRAVTQDQSNVSGPSQQGEAAHAPEPPGERLAPWVYIHSPLEQWMADYQRTFEAWADGGVRGIVVGPLRFFQEVPQYEMSYQYQYAGARFPTFPPDPKVYKAYGVAPPPEEPRDPSKEKQLQAMLDDAASRGWEILLFGSGQIAGARPLEEDPFGVVGFAASVQDTMNAFPQAQGIVTDGPGEQSYELAFHHGGEVFEIPEDLKARLAHLDIDIARMERGAARFRNRFQHLTSAMVRYYSPGGTLGGLALFDPNEDALYWLRTRQEVTVRYMAALRRQIGRTKPQSETGWYSSHSRFFPSHDAGLSQDEPVLRLYLP